MRVYPSPILESGTRLGPYEIVAPIGAGGMGEVYRARDTRLDRSVAIKIVTDESLKQRFDREAKTISSLNHPNICALYDVGDAYIAMELLEGETQREKLDGFRGGTLPADAMPYTTEHGVPTIEIDVNGKKFNVDIDSGSPAEVTLPLSAAKDLTLAAQPQIFGRAQVGGQPLDVYGAPLQGTVRVGSITLTNPRLDFLDLPIGNLGYRFLNSLMVTFDPKNRRLQFGNRRAER